MNPKDVEAIVQAMRTNLLKLGSERHTEEFVLREVYRDFNRNKEGVLSLDDFKGMLAKLNLSAPDMYLEALMDKFDRNGNGIVEFEEVLQYVVYDRYHKY